MSVILIVDDDPMLRVIAGEMLRDGGHEVLEAGDGDQALKRLASHPVDLIVLDMLMPNKDGLETIIELRNDHPAVRILAISSGGRGSGASLLNTALAFGAHAALAKPLRAGTFTAAIDALLATRPQREGLERPVGIEPTTFSLGS